MLYPLLFSLVLPTLQFNDHDLFIFLYSGEKFSFNLELLEGVDLSYDFRDSTSGQHCSQDIQYTYLSNLRVQQDYPALTNVINVSRLPPHPPSNKSSKTTRASPTS